MQIGKSFSWLVFLITMAALGLALIYLPGWVIDKYNIVSKLGAIWGWLYLVVVALGSLLFLGSIGVTVWKLWGSSVLKKIRREQRSKNPSELSYGQKTTEIDENIKQLRELKDQSGNNPKLQAQLEPLLVDVVAKRQLMTLEIVAFGTISSGKSSVLNLLAGQEIFATDVRGGTTVTRNEVPWKHHDKVILVDTPGLGEIDGEQHVWVAADAAKDADIVLMVVDGPLRESEHKLLVKLGPMEKRIIVCLNKSDWYHPEDREKLLGQLREQTKNWVDPEEVVSIQAQVGTRVRKRVTPSGETIDETVPVQPDIGPLAERMMSIVKRDGKELVMANLLLQSRGVLEKAKEQVTSALNEKAWTTVERYSWGAGGMAAVNPFPLVDLAVGLGISTKMIVDLADVYGQKIDLQTASKWLGEMGKILISVVGSQGAAAVATSVGASLIKAVPFAGTLVGSVLQGAVQALITRWVGSVFIEYFSHEMNFADGGLANTARRQWEKLTTIDELRRLVTQARQKIAG